VRVAVDTNVLVYAEGLDDAGKHTISARTLRKLADDETLIPVQVLGELFNVLLRRGYTRIQAAKVIRGWRQICRSIETGAELLDRALELSVRHRLQIWDAVILDAAAEGNCAVLLSEDFQNGFVWRGVTVCDPFVAKPHPLIADLVRGR
jgi:predicted nucleic acid-binding protein